MADTDDRPEMVGCQASRNGAVNRRTFRLCDILPRKVTFLQETVET